MMHRIRRQYSACLFVLIAALAHAVPPAAAKALATLQSVTVSSNAAGITVEIAASQPVAPRSQVTTDPDRLVLDFPDSQPAPDLRSKLLNQGDIKGFRVARYSANPPVTRVVIDLNSPQHYQIFPDGKTVIVKLVSDQQQAAVRAHLNNVNFTPVPAKPVPTLQVNYQDGRLSIVAQNSSLADVLNEIHRQTGTDIPIPPGAGQEQIVANIGPLPLREAMTSLLNGSRYNFILVDSDREPGKLKSVILTFRGAGGMSQPAVASTEPPPAVENTPEPEPPTQPEQQPEPPPQEGQGQPEAPQPQDAPPPPQ